MKTGFTDLGLPTCTVQFFPVYSRTLKGKLCSYADRFSVASLLCVKKKTGKKEKKKSWARKRCQPRPLTPPLTPPLRFLRAKYPFGSRRYRRRNRHRTILLPYRTANFYKTPFLKTISEMCCWFSDASREPYLSFFCFSILSFILSSRSHPGLAHYVTNCNGRVSHLFSFFLPFLYTSLQVEQKKREKLALGRDLWYINI